MAVVEGLAGVWGSGAAVVDASVFPPLSLGHPQSTVYTLVEKIVAAMVAGRT